MIVKFNSTRNRFEAEFTKAEFQVAYPVVKGAGFRFDGNAAPKVWYTAEKAIAANLREYIVPEDVALLDNVVAASITKQVSLKASRAEDSLAEIPAPAGLSYLPFQRAGIEYAMHRANTLVADEMGLGKTIQAIGVSNVDPTVRRVLIICPASLKLNWQREWQKWDIKGLTVGIVNAGEPLPATDVVIANYDIIGEDIVKKTKKGGTCTIKKLNTELHITWDLLIVDECHKVKNPKAVRTQYILGKKASKKKDKTSGKMVATEAIEPIPAKRRVFLTGTPICNRPVELWPLVEALDPAGLGRSFFGFASRYCGATQGRFGWDFKGASNLAELQDKLREVIMVRRLKADVLKELPAKRRQVVIVEPDSHGRELIEKEKQAWEKCQVNEGDAIALSELSKVRHEVALYKMPFVIEQVKDMLEDGGVDKLVVMAHHRDVVEGIQAAFENAVLVHGDVTLDARQAAVDRFQTDPTCQVFVGTIIAAGVGLTLTAASTVVFGELDWVPGNVTQSEDRCHRIGQKETVHVQHIILDESLDAKMINMVLDKQAVIDAALDKVPEPVEKEMPKVGLPEVVKADPKKPGTVVIKGQAISLTQEQISAIHAGLKMLRAKCDGAHDEDGMGFSGVDVQFGWSMAAALNLSLKQAAYGQKMIRKYQGQLPTELVQAAGVEPKQ